MEDSEIIALFFDRNPSAIEETSKKYGAYCKAVAVNILGNNEDAEECVNDTYLNTWNAIPPHKPAALAAFLGKITRNLSFNRYKQQKALKRGGGQIALVLDELSDCVSGGEVEQEIDRLELVEAINAFLDALPEEKRSVFLCRYWYSDAISDIAERCGMNEGKVSMSLSRMRKKLRLHLLERGFEL